MYSKELEVLDTGCGCERDCVKKFELSEIWQSRLGSKDYDTNCEQHVNHQKLSLLGSLNTIMRTNDKTMQKEHLPKERKQTYTKYLLRGVKVCRKFYQFVFGCGEKRLKNMKNHLMPYGLEQKAHKNARASLKMIPF